ncbi:GNAT family N-acetyltransferase [Solihabitans fulvus]|uniref:GNAT family N-acetyltransferase n=1 Tax=Solihabitans fulvus TaxID=1892852 RepID=A0A5B2XUK7_9PSEU|nr:GNAT family N-acetyltransferase [Solihabitans fulvus]KAA2266630.1 GNAT family N-acetyltransferase [Solihabitans fulvus]
MIRDARLPEESTAIAALDTGFSTDTIYRVGVAEAGFTLTEERVDPPVVKRYQVDDLDDPVRDLARVAVDGDELCGFVSAEYQEWNRRLVVWDLYVNASHRGRGLARSLVRDALAYGRERGAVTAWLETSNRNVPAIRAYRRMGFALCGLDTTLYLGTESAGEVAVFLAMPLDVDRA